ncbi:MAG: thiamine pyrophosphate-dependent dehydrogenase E1 component subunit alpha [Chloroflexi bacterium]|nr:thiamine pyrophosphate-dependent dehydrogenase E1 component subunit alpha [Chloroflexota bacterium]MCL5275720.1 thiamine pyrophosphate-dependent dehydrogenase E1 component subunit alpha [Chloroflexota bacterium]
MAFSKDLLLRMYERMCLIRAFEERLMELYKGGEIRGSLHPSIGQEGTAVGSTFALNPDDYMTCTYRGHGAAIAKGIDVNAAMAEMLGRRTGISKGKGGSMHWTDPSIGLLGENAIVGAGVPIAAGAALSAQMDGKGRVALTIFGDGALHQGVLNETLNIAQLWKLPLILLCENNLYAEMTPVGESTPLKKLADRARGYAMKAVTIDGNDVCEVYETVGKAAARARAGDGPTFIEALTYRFSGHMIGDPETYRTREEVAEWRKRDPILLLRDHLAQKFEMPEGDLNQIIERANKQVDEAVEFANSSPLPEPSDVATDVWA